MYSSAFLHVPLCIEDDNFPNLKEDFWGLMPLIHPSYELSQRDKKSCVMLQSL